jgi:two-component system OmpR family response regulator
VQARFGWLSSAGEIPARWDLRLLGWQLVASDQATAHPRLFDGRDGSRFSEWGDLPQPALTVAVGVACGQERAAMIAAGLGEALPMEVALGELSVRMSRLALGAGALPRYRRIGPVTLDLLHRDASSAGRWLALHPREFALLWRLADAPGERVPRERLLRDVWRLTHVPETNSLEVHVSRLRAKLAVAKAAWLVETHPHGGYRLACANAGASWTVSAPLPTVTAT